MSNDQTNHSQITADGPLRTVAGMDPTLAICAARPWFFNDVLVIYNTDIDEHPWVDWTGPGGAPVEDDRGLANWTSARLADACRKLQEYIRDQYRLRQFRAVSLDFIGDMIKFLWRDLSQARCLGWAREWRKNPKAYVGAVGTDPSLAYESWGYTVLYRLANAARTALLAEGRQGPRLQVTAPIFPNRLLYSGADGMTPWGMMSYPTADGQPRVPAQDYAERFVPLLKILDAVLVGVYHKAVGVYEARDAVPETWTRGELPIEAQFDYIAGNIHQGLELAALAGGKPTWVMGHSKYCQHSAFVGKPPRYLEPHDMACLIDALEHTTHKGKRAAQLHLWDAIGTEGRVGTKPHQQVQQLTAWLDGIFYPAVTGIAAPAGTGSEA